MEKSSVYRKWNEDFCQGKVRRFGSFGIGVVVTAQAQTVPKSLEEGGTDAAMKWRKNNWTVGVAGGQLSGTYMTFAK
jgi:hypothetical protein